MGADKIEENLIVPSLDKLEMNNVVHYVYKSIELYGQAR
jgi:hypothetical protein